MLKHAAKCFVTGIFCLLGAAAAVAAPSAVRQTPAVLAVQKAMPWVVSIGTVIQTHVNDPYYNRRNDYFSLFPEIVRQRLVKEYTPLGSGIIIHESGLVLTNWHVARSAEKLILRPKDGKAYPACVVGYDPKCDLCLLKLVGDFGKDPLAPASFAASEDLLLGESVITLGNPFGLEHSVSQGVLSAINRSLGLTGDTTYNDMLQTDAAINPGNSGGPLINLEGDIIGINQAVRSDAQGIGFAIPVKRLEQFMATWLIPETFSDAMLGIRYATLDDGTFALSILPDSPAAQAGLKDGDVLKTLQGKPVNRLLDIAMAIWSLKKGDILSCVTADGRAISILLRPMTDAELVSQRLGLKVQKLTPALNTALELPQNLKGLAINDIPAYSQYREQETALRQYLKRGDLILQVNGESVPDLPALATILRKGCAGSIISINYAILGRQQQYVTRMERIFLQ